MQHIGTQNRATNVAGENWKNSLTPFLLTSTLYYQMP